MGFGLPVLIIRPSPRDWYWAQVKAGRIVAWEGCHGALLGVGALPGHPLVSVYDHSRLAAALGLEVTNMNLTTVAGPAVTGKVAAMYARRNILTADFGERTPYYVF